MMKRQFHFIRTPKLEKIVAESKEILCENTDSKTIAWLVHLGYGVLIKDRRN